jgi:hypothetical protein
MFSVPLSVIKELDDADHCGRKDMATVDLEILLAETSMFYNRSISLLSDISHNAMNAGSKLNSLRIWDDRNEATADAINVLFDVNASLQLLVGRMREQELKITEVRSEIMLQCETGPASSMIEYVATGGREAA